jgi:hypothetical protein
VVQGGNVKTKEDLLVVFGGIGEDSRVLSDVNILDLGSLAWVNLPQPVGSDIPSPGTIHPIFFTKSTY